MTDEITPFHQQLREDIQRVKDAADDNTPGLLMAALRSYGHYRTIALDDPPGTNPTIETEIAEADPIVNEIRDAGIRRGVVHAFTHEQGKALADEFQAPVYYWCADGELCRRSPDGKSYSLVYMHSDYEAETDIAHKGWSLAHAEIAGLVEDGDR